AQPSAAAIDANMPSDVKPPLATNHAPTEPAVSQPTLAIVMFRPNNAPRNSLGISASVAINDGRPVAFTREYAKPKPTDAAMPGCHISVGNASTAVSPEAIAKTHAHQSL